MPKSDHIQARGVVLKSVGDGFFRVRLDNEHEVLARPSGKMSRHYIRLLPDDVVDVEISTYDLDRGRITYRYK